MGISSEQSEARCGFCLHVPSAFLSSKCSCMPGSQEYTYYDREFNFSRRKFSWVPHSSTQPTCSERLPHLIQRLPVPAVSHAERRLLPNILSCCSGLQGREPFLLSSQAIHTAHNLVPCPSALISSGCKELRLTKVRTGPVDPGLHLPN